MLKYNLIEFIDHTQNGEETANQNLEPIKTNYCLQHMQKSEEMINERSEDFDLTCTGQRSTLYNRIEWNVYDEIEQSRIEQKS